MSSLFSRKIDWTSPVTIQAMRWFNCREIPPDATDFYCYLLHKAMSEHADVLIGAPDKSMPDASPRSKEFRRQTPEAAAKTFVELGKRLAPFQGRVPALTEDDHKALVDAAELDALPDNYLHETGRWTVTPRLDLIWKRVHARIAAEAEASGTITAADKRRMARQAKHMEAMRARAERRQMKAWELK